MPFFILVCLFERIRRQLGMGHNEPFHRILRQNYKSKLLHANRCKKYVFIFSTETRFLEGKFFAVRYCNKSATRDSNKISNLKLNIHNIFKHFRFQKRNKTGSIRNYNRQQYLANVRRDNYLRILLNKSQHLHYKFILKTLCSCLNRESQNYLSDKS